MTYPEMAETLMRPQVDSSEPSSPSGEAVAAPADEGPPAARSRAGNAPAGRTAASEGRRAKVVIARAVKERDGSPAGSRVTGTGRPAKTASPEQDSDDSEEILAEIAYLLLGER